MILLRLITARVQASGGGYDPDAQAFFTAAGITNTTEKDAVNTLVLDLKSTGIWAKMYAIYPMVVGTTTSCSYNLKNPATYQMSFAGSWTVDSGGILPSTAGNTTIYADTGFNLSTDLTSQNDISVGVYCSNPTNNISQPCSEIGASDSNFYGGIGILAAENNLTAFCANSSSNIYYNDAANYTSGTYNSGTYYVTGKGFFVSSRTSSTVYSGFVRGTDYKNFSTSSTSSAMPNKTVHVGACNSTDGSSVYQRSTNKKISFAFIGLGLTNSDVDTYFECVQKLNTALLRYEGIPYYSSYDSDAQTYITAAGLTSFFDKSAANYIVANLKSNSLWTKFTAIYPYLGSSTTAQGYNLKNTASYNLSYTGSGISSNTEGLQIVQDASFNYADTGLSDSSLNATNTHIAHWHKNTTYPQPYYLGLYSIALAKGTFLGHTGIYVFQSNNALAGNIQTGLHLAQKPSAGTTEIYNQGTLTTSNSNTDATATGLNLYIGGLNSYGLTSGDGRANGVFNYSSIGEGFTSGENSTYYSIVKTAMRSIGRSSN